LLLKTREKKKIQNETRKAASSAPATVGRRSSRASSSAPSGRAVSSRYGVSE